MILEIKNFIIHLRLHYQIFILSAPYLLGVLLSGNITQLQIIQFFSVHVLLFGGVTAYNSYFDKDEGPVGGLMNPPKMKRWMYYASWVLQCIGLGIATLSGLYFIIAYVTSMIFFWLYSSPKVRYKARPIGSLFVIGLGTVVCASFLGFYASGFEQMLSSQIMIASIGSMLLVISMYPLSQVYQIEEDKKRGDITFVVQYGKKGVRNIFSLLYPAGLILVAYTLSRIELVYAIIFLIGGLSSGVFVYLIIKSLAMIPHDYRTVMLIKYVSGLSFSVFIFICILFA